ncbi:MULTISPECIES: glycosyltransferase family 2 protein [unclassified Janthinobacterium]|uniref:glycosyltransferase family 2 protein n=1 Tax=unclassified Janthinobacterium TaxID=2610881 RepID=UPI000347ED77|nr:MULTISPECIES: glycosyltransferase family 2 protein [unclassified Janthinobacterium]MEC5159794.1 glycosyltransferase involved in cell wall biosynthesis [Janthinobacterium sp. CG_S6]
MKVSIITVCYNSEKTIRDTIESVLSQDYQDIEYIIIDGASSDGTMAIVNEYRERVATIISEPDKGIYDAMNKGVRAATGEVVGILNSDDFYESGQAVSAVARAFHGRPALDIVFGDVVFVHAGDLNLVRRHYGAARFKAWKLRFGWMPPHPGTFVRRALYWKTGWYRTDFKIAADYEMFVRWLLVGRASYRWIDQVLVRMRMGGVSTGGLKSSLLLNREIVRACKANHIYTNLFLVMSKLPFKLLELCRRPS